MEGKEEEKTHGLRVSFTSSSSLRVTQYLRDSVHRISNDIRKETGKVFQKRVKHHGTIADKLSHVDYYVEMVKETMPFPSPFSSPSTSFRLIIKGAISDFLRTGRYLALSEALEFYRNFSQRSYVRVCMQLHR